MERGETVANKRMFSKDVVESDAFLDLPLSAQALYFHLAMAADDEGFIGNPQRIRGMLGVAVEDLQRLIDQRLLIDFESGVVVIRHWKLHNCIQKDRFTATIYLDEKAAIEVNSKKEYVPSDPSVYKMYTQVRLGKVRLGKVRTTTTTAQARARAQAREENKSKEGEGSIDELAEEIARDIPALIDFLDEQDPDEDELDELAELKRMDLFESEIMEHFEKEYPKLYDAPGVGIGKRFDPNNEARKFIAYNAKRGWDCLPDWQKAADLWVERIGEDRRRRE